MITVPQPGNTTNPTYPTLITIDWLCTIGPQPATRTVTKKCEPISKRNTTSEIFIIPGYFSVLFYSVTLYNELWSRIIQIKMLDISAIRYVKYSVQLNCYKSCTSKVFKLFRSSQILNVKTGRNKLN